MGWETMAGFDSRVLAAAASTAGSACCQPANKHMGWIPCGRSGLLHQIWRLTFVSLQHARKPHRTQLELLGKEADTF